MLLYAFDRSLVSTVNCWPQTAIGDIGWYYQRVFSRGIYNKSACTDSSKILLLHSRSCCMEQSTRSCTNREDTWSTVDVSACRV